ncbi:MAG TPA: hypothetical protein VM938_03650 [Acidimicrobiales bacterium]|nr:hypothetical protein [Acidimicrobiales bacterium]
MEAIGRAELRKFGLPADVVDDLLQDAAAVVMRKRPWFTSSEDLAPYVRIVVRRRALHWLRDRRREVIGAVPDRAATHGVAELAEHRMRLRGVAQAFEGLPPEERERFVAYLKADERVGDVRERARERKQVERIRATMSRVAEGLAAAFGRWRMRFPWLDAVPPQVSAAFVVVSLAAGVLLPAPWHQEDVAATTQRIANVRMPKPAPESTPAPVADSHPDLPPVKAERAPRRDDATTRPAAKEVVRIAAPTGDQVKWEKQPNGPDEHLVCTGGKLMPGVCVPQPWLPW